MNTKNTVVYTSNGWGPCNSAKSWLRENYIDFIEKNIEDDLNRMELINKGYKVTPVIMVGETAVVGFQPQTLREVFSK